MNREVSSEMVKEFANVFQKDQVRRNSQRAVLKNGILASSENSFSVIENTPIFSIDLETGAVSNQKQSGRCWLFAALNTFRHKIATDINLKEFELSQNYMFFWDKFEKANYFYENIIATGAEKLDSRKVAFLLATPQQDGGQWDMVVSLVEKYGVVPKSVMPESFSSSSSRELNNFLNKKLRKDAKVLRDLISENVDEATLLKTKNDLLMEVYNLLATSLGTPPQEFNFEYRDSENNYFHKSGLTPQNFYKEFVGVDLTEYVSVINAPTSDKPYHQLYTVEMLGNVIGGREVRHLNVDMETLKSGALK